MLSDAEFFGNPRKIVIKRPEDDDHGNDHGKKQASASAVAVDPVDGLIQRLFLCVDQGDHGDLVDLLFDLMDTGWADLPRR